ncbi:MAG TPA: hypothetical protein VM598_06710 [Bdellovibrionota bacterium]|nr:hypothetical protein [Bdellovibrionota bacterium]
MRSFQALPDRDRAITFYSEGPEDWPHLGPIVESLLAESALSIAFLTSSALDPAHRLASDRFRVFDIGSGIVRTILFRVLRSRLLVLTLPDLGSFHLKRSVRPVHYAYVFHSLNSTHTSYRERAFDAYDTLFCSGPHHVTEIRRREERSGLARKQLVRHGSSRLDALLLQAGRPPTGTTREVVVAPSWGSCSLIERPMGPDLVASLLSAGYRVTLRLHPMTTRRLPELVGRLRHRFQENPEFRLETDVTTHDSWLRSCAMITDWSGAASEYAFGLQRPVIYVETPQKINNPAWGDLGCSPFEDFIRAELGRILPVGSIQDIPRVLDEELGELQETRRATALAARDRWVYNVGSSARIASEWIKDFVSEKP